MKTKNHINSSLFLFGFVLIGFLNAYSQTASTSEDEKILSPSEEIFEKAEDLIVPWRSSGCGLNIEFNEPDCRVVTFKESANSDFLTIYNEDGSIWYQFSLSPQKANYFLKNKNSDFLPFSTGRIDHPIEVFLRQTGESKNWYRAEVNEKTQAVKYILKSDPFWAKTTWSFWLYDGFNLYIDSKRTKLHDKPNGQIIEASADLNFERVKFLKADGDWAYVIGTVYPKDYYGWIRWLKGRDLLVGTSFNNMKVPQSQENPLEK